MYDVLCIRETAINFITNNKIMIFHYQMLPPVNISYESFKFKIIVSCAEFRLYSTFKSERETHLLVMIDEWAHCH